jgi:hypothetical protein
MLLINNFIFPAVVIMDLTQKVILKGLELTVQKKFTIRIKHLAKAIQEQQALIKALEQRLLILENK